MTHSIDDMRQRQLGSVAVEFAVVGVVYLTLGGLLLTAGLADATGLTVALSLGCAIVFGGITVGKWRALLPRSAAHAETVSRKAITEVAPAQRWFLHRRWSRGLCLMGGRDVCDVKRVGRTCRALIWRGL